MAEKYGSISQALDNPGLTPRRCCRAYRQEPPCGLAARVGAVIGIVRRFAALRLCAGPSRLSGRRQVPATVCRLCEYAASATRRTWAHSGDVLDKWNKIDQLYMFTHDAIGSLSNAKQFLMRDIANRNQQVPAGCELRQQRCRHLGGRRCYQNRVVGGVFRPAVAAVAEVQAEIPVTQLLKTAARTFMQGFDALHGIHFLCQRTQDSGLIARAGTDFKYTTRA